MTTNLLFSLFGNIQITKDTITLTHRYTKVDFLHSCPPCFHLNKQNLLFHFCSAVWLVQAEVKAALTQLQMGARPVDLCHLIKRVSNKESDHDNTPAHAVTHWKTHTYKSSTTWLQDRWHKFPHTHTHTHSHTNTHTHTQTHKHKPTATSVYPNVLWSFYRKSFCTSLLSRSRRFELPLCSRSSLAKFYFIV